MDLWRRKIGITFVLLCMIFSLLGSTVFAAEGKVWVQKQPMPFARAGVSSAVANGKVYVFGGSGGSSSYNNVQEYDPQTDTWQAKKNMPTARSGTSSVAVNGKIYVFGGYTGNYFTWSGGNTLDTVEMYDPATDTWTSKKSMPIQVGDVATAVYEGKIYVFGGLTNGAISVSNVNIYDPATDTWTAKTNMAQTIHSSIAVVLNDKIYLVGGVHLDGSGMHLKSLKEYNPVTDTWSSKADLPVATASISATIYSNKIFAIGGDTPSETSIVRAYDPVNNEWISQPSLNVARFGATAVSINNKIYVFGGGQNSTSNTPINVTESFGNESSPIQLNATSGDKSISLNWSSSENTSGYVIKRSTSEGGPYETIETGLADTSFIDTNVTNGTTYYYIVSAVNESGESVQSNEVSATPQGTVTPPPSSGNRAILTVTMNTGLDKEFDLSMDEVNAFTTWYEAKAAGTGTASFAIDKHDNNKGPFKSRKDYVIFDKILSFEVSEYDIAD